MTNSTLSSDQKTIMTLYAMIVVGSILMVIPISILPMAGLSCVLVGFLASYIYKFRAKDNELMAFHASFLIRTVWISSLILLATIILFGSIVYFNADMTALNALIAEAEKGLVPTDSDIAAMQLTFVNMNKELIMAAALALLPYPIYLVMRVFRGVRMLTNKKTG